MALLPFAPAPFNPVNDTLHVLKAGDTMTGQLVMNNTTVANAGVINATSTDTNPAASVTAISNVSNASQTTADTALFVRGMFNDIQIAATNTKNWTGATGLVGMQNTVNILSGATGTITNATALLSNVQSSSSTGTITNAYGIRAINLKSGSGTITNSMTALLYGLGQATNNTGVYLATGTSIPSAPSGNYGIYDSTGYNNYIAGSLGIGNTSPSFPLDVTGAARTTGNLTVPSENIQNFNLSPSTFYTGGVVPGLLLQNNQTNVRTLLGIVPNGSAGLADLWVFNTSDTTTNYSALAWGYEGSSGNWGINVAVGGTESAKGIYFNATNGQSATTSNLLMSTNGRVGIGGITTPTAKLHLPAGTATANTSPLKLTSGTNLTTTEAGAIEYDGSHLYFTASNAGTRFQLDQQGTVTAVSIASANGFAGSSSGGSTPALTISTSITGVLKGNGTAISAATAGTDYQAPITLTTTGSSGAATFIANTLNIPNYSSGSGGITRSVNNVSTTTSAGSTASTDYVYLATGTFTITLPTAASNTNRYTIKNVSTGTVSIATTSTQTIDGSTTVTLPVQYTSLDLVSDGSNWNVV